MAGDDFLWLGNHPAPDLCNTRPVVGGRPRELLAGFTDVLRWARGAGIDVPHQLADRADDRAAEEARRWVVRLRDELRGVIDPTLTTRDVTALNVVLAQERGAFQLVDASHNVPGAVRVVGDDEMSQFRLDLAAAVLDIFTKDMRLVRRCQNPDCVLLFLDLSKSHGRRWCDMRTCGNRAKAAAHYARTRPVPQP